MWLIVGRIAAMVLGQGVVGWITKNLMAIAIFGGVLAVSNLATGLYAGFHWYNKAAAKCQTASLRREISELKRDLSVAKDNSAFLNQRMTALQEKGADYDRKVADYEAELAKRPVAGCVLTPADINSVRRRRAR